ncbi:MAG: amidohydrolase family protein [Paludibacteraceae bacterium]|nr:amidohydrolase family protein [Paludibacteraceae bacterium]MBQ6983765.1 amidohydrolase family protein [Paludibacteraceae bacterium]MBQ6984526.1 amidohydrolase family protein [Paludibacteraceae bacterium]
MRKRITIILLCAAMSAMAQVTDWHSHAIPDSYRELVARHGSLLDEGFPLPRWSAEAHLQLMDEAGIETSVLTLPAPHPYWGDIEETKREVRRLNEEMAEITNDQSPITNHKLAFCATLPLPDVDAAIAEARYAMDSLGAVGVKLATNVYGQYLGDSVLDPLMQFLSDRHAVVILHPHKPTPVNAQVMQQTPLAMQEYLSETTRAVCNMLSRNVLARYPNMRVIVPHAGAFLPIAIPRMRSLYPVMKQNGLVGEIDFEANIASLWFDLAGSPSDETVQALLTLTTRDHLLYGSDYPYVAPQVIKNNMERMKSYMKPSAISSQSSDGLIIRIAEIEVHKKYLNEYLAAAHEVGATSVKEEEGVICIFPMQVKDKPTTIRIVEIYRDEAAYQSHLQTPHFLAYKQGTLHMVESLRLVPVDALAPEAMPLIFEKLK